MAVTQRDRLTDLAGNEPATTVNGGYHMHREAAKMRSTVRAVSPDEPLIIQPNTPDKVDAPPPYVDDSPKSMRRRRPSGQVSSERPKTMIEVTPEQPSVRSGSRSRTKTLGELSSDTRPRLRNVSSTGSVDEGFHPKREVLPAPPKEPISGMSFCKSKCKSDSNRGHGSGNEGKKAIDQRQRLVKQSKRPATPENKEPDLTGGTLPSPIRISNANRILDLMRASKGVMAGDVELRGHEGGNWSFAHCLIDEDGRLVQRSTAKQTQTLLPDLRRCKVKTAPFEPGQPHYLVITVEKSSMSLHLQPLDDDDLDRWLAALIFWQPNRVRSSSEKKSRSRGASLPYDTASRSSTDRRPSTDSGFSTDAAIIKVGQVLLLQQVTATPRNPKSRKGSMSRNPPQPATVHSWQKVQCVLRENGEFKLYTEMDAVMISVIQLSALSRCAIQRLDPSVLDQPYCIAIYPSYSVTSTILSLIHPIYLSFECNVLYEVWLVLLRAFAVPELYGPRPSGREAETEVSAGSGAVANSISDMFRVERSISVRIVEARLWPPRPKTGSETSSSSRTRSSKKDPSVGNYLAEILLDGQLRARTIQVPSTNNPFWRDDFDFNDLPGTTPSLSVMLKRPVEDKPSMLSSLRDSQPPPNLSTAVMDDADSQECYGRMDLNVDNLDPSEDNESWWSLANRDEENVGEVLLRTRSEELIVLMSSDYRALAELLRRAPSHLATAIAEAVPGKLQRISEVLLNIYQVSGLANRYLMNLIEDEIEGIQQQQQQQSAGYNAASKFRERMGSNDSTDFRHDREMMKSDMGASTTVQANLLFRGNSLLTKSFELHMSRIGKDYLDDTLASSIRTINESDMDCEVDPSRLSTSSSLEINWRNLMNLFRIVWSSVHGSAQRCPRELRLILRHIRACAETRWGKFQGTVSYSSVSGFLFLRFFCPAILNPKLFGLLKGTSLV